MTADDTSREALIERVRELQRSVRELQAARDTYREHWRQLMRDYEAVFKERDELEAENERLHSWQGLLSLLDEHWPESIFPTAADDAHRDTGPRLVSALRQLDAAREQVRQRDEVIERVRALVDEWGRRGAASGPFPDRVVLDVDTEVLGPLRAALEGEQR